MWIVLAVITILIGGYYLSLKLNPWVKCRKCGGQPRVKAWAFGHAHHTCPNCNGTGQQIRWGYKFFRIRPANPR